MIRPILLSNEDAEIPARPESPLRTQAEPPLNGPETLHKKPMPRKVPPHMRRLNMRFSSPSDNLSPMSQKLMLADRNNAAAKSILPKSLKDALLQARDDSAPHPRLPSCTRKQDYMSDDEMCSQMDTDADEDVDMSDEQPPSPTKSSRGDGGGGLVKSL